MNSVEPPIPPTLPDWTALWPDTLGWSPTTEQVQQFQTLYTQILEGNQRLNLTRITEPIAFAEKHLWDSLRGIQSFLSPTSTSNEQPTPAACTAIDIGTGAGFPGLPVAIAQPHWTVTLLDSTRKKMTFIEQLLPSLQLTTVKPIVGRVEDIGQQRHHREHYDLALIRAVAAASVCAEYSLPLLKVGGLAVLYRGQWTAAETIALAEAVSLLGGQIEAIDHFQTPITNSERHCISLRKVRSTPAQYPRAIGIPEQKPLTPTEQN